LGYSSTACSGARTEGRDIDEAKATLAESIKLKPEVNSIAKVRAIPIAGVMDCPQLVALKEKTTYVGLRRAGLPDE
jgi:adenylate cyclase